LDGHQFSDARNGYLLLGLYEWDKLAIDAGVARDGNGFRGVTLAYCVREKDDLERVLVQACHLTFVRVPPYLSAVALPAWQVFTSPVVRGSSVNFMRADISPYARRPTLWLWTSLGIIFCGATYFVIADALPYLYRFSPATYGPFWPKRE